jgi:hypothetical protein
MPSAWVPKLSTFRLHRPFIPPVVVTPTEPHVAEIVGLKAALATLQAALATATKMIAVERAALATKTRTSYVPCYFRARSFPKLPCLATGGVFCGDGAAFGHFKTPSPPGLSARTPGTVSAPAVPRASAGYRRCPPWPIPKRGCRASAVSADNGQARALVVAEPLAAGPAGKRFREGRTPGKGSCLLL